MDINIEIDHFKVVYLVACPLNENEAGVHLVLIETSLAFYVNDAVLLLICRNLHKKGREVSIKARSSPASLPCKGQAAKHRTVKWSIVWNCQGAVNYISCIKLLTLDKSSSLSMNVLL